MGFVKSCMVAYISRMDEELTKPRKYFAAYDGFDLIALFIIVGFVWYFDVIRLAKEFLDPIIRPIVCQLLQLLGLG